MAEMKTVSGDVLLIDDGDVPMLEGKRLYSLRSRGLLYATFMVWDKSEKKSHIVLTHRHILDAPPGVLVDHRNRNGLDNRRANLRLADHSLNGANLVTHSGTSQYKGVLWNRRAGRWNARITVKGKQRHLGTFLTEEDAARAYDTAAASAWGEYARVNLPGLPLLEEEELIRSQNLTSKFRGVSWSERTRNWQVGIFIDGKSRALGRYADPVLAAYVYDRAAHESGLGAGRMNFPEENSPERRALTASLMAQERMLARGATSLFRGVSWNTRENCWRATISRNRKQRLIGKFSTQEEAAKAYDREALALWGDAALPRLNFPLERQG